MSTSPLLPGIVREFSGGAVELPLAKARELFDPDHATRTGAGPLAACRAALELQRLLEGHGQLPLPEGVEQCHRRLRAGTAEADTAALVA